MLQRFAVLSSLCSVYRVARGGATVLKVGGTNSASEASRKIFLTPPSPLFGQWGGTKYCQNKDDTALTLV